MTKKKINKILSLKEAGKVIGVSRDAVYKAVKIRKTLPSEKIGSQWTVKLNDALYYKNHRKGKPGRPKKNR